MNFLFLFDFFSLPSFLHSGYQILKSSTYAENLKFLQTCRKSWPYVFHMPFKFLWSNKGSDIKLEPISIRLFFNLLITLSAQTKYNISQGPIETVLIHTPKLSNSKHTLGNELSTPDVVLTAAHLAHTFCTSDHFPSPFKLKLFWFNRWLICKTLSMLFFLITSSLFQQRSMVLTNYKT